VISIPAAAWQRIAAAARAAYPEECCGLLVGVVEGRAVRVTRVEAAKNVARPSRRDRFEIDPRRQFALLRTLRGTPERIVGHYHSHPDAEPVPSVVDRDSVFDPTLVWVIVAVDGGRVDGAAFRVDTASGDLAAIPLLIGR
jgi:proteasome lid subunit RPN8/RPN11